MASVLPFLWRPSSVPRCRDAIGWLDSDREGSLAPGLRARLDRHLAGCQPCRRYRRQYAETIRIAREAFGLADDEGNVPAELVTGILSACRKA